MSDFKTKAEVEGDPLYERAQRLLKDLMAPITPRTVDVCVKVFMDVQICEARRVREETIKSLKRGSKN